MPAKKSSSKKPNFGSSDLIAPGGHVPATSYNRDLSERNRRDAARSTKRPVKKTGTSRQRPR